MVEYNAKFLQAHQVDIKLPLSRIFADKLSKIFVGKSNQIFVGISVKILQTSRTKFFAGRLLEFISQQIEPRINILGENFCVNLRCSDIRMPKHL